MVILSKTTAFIQITDYQSHTSTAYSRRSIVHASEMELHVVATLLNFFNHKKHHQRNAMPLKPVHTIDAYDLRLT